MQTETSRIEPYRDDEVASALQELFAMPAFIEGMKKFLPPSLVDLMITEKDYVRTVFGIQERMIYPVLKMIEQASIEKLSSSGIEQLSKDQSYLFISNHRDIVLDSAYLNLLLFENKIPTSQIAIGNNLVVHRMSELLFRLNKSFVVMRKGQPRELYQHAIKLSNYILDQIHGNQSSVWIAQREGRAKDGNDLTQVSLLKMLSLSAKGSLADHFKNLQIVPVSIAYEFDPTDVVKTQSHLAKLANPDYKKTFEEDVAHILLGLNGQKGHVHIHFGNPLSEELDQLADADSDKLALELLAKIIDQQIHQNYQLHPINYVAADLLNEQQEFQAHYSLSEFARFTNEFKTKIEQFPPEQKEDGRKYLLGMYANPLLNAVATNV